MVLNWKNIMRQYFGITRFKKRTSKMYKSYKTMYFFYNYIIPMNTSFLPRRFIRFFRRKFKKFLKKKKLKFYLFLKFNFIVSYKGKNPRMGKGVGFFVRKAMIIKQNTPIFLLKRPNYNRSLKFCHYFKKKTHLHSYVYRQSWYF